jgi:1-deoxy-D-xylulose-5-phosphate synthase
MQGRDAAGIEAAVTARFGALLAGKPGKPALKSVA